MKSNVSPPTETPALAVTVYNGPAMYQHNATCMRWNTYRTTPHHQTNGLTHRTLHVVVCNGKSKVWDYMPDTLQTAGVAKTSYALLGASSAISLGLAAI